MVLHISIRKCLSKAFYFVSRKCSGSTGNAEDDEDLTLDVGVIRKGDKVLVC